MMVYFSQVENAFSAEEQKENISFFSAELNNKKLGLKYDNL